jgi:superfamily II DNA/RNA helicase
LLQKQREWYDVTFHSGFLLKPYQGADIPDIELVIQFGVPASLSIFSQRAGRAGRSPHIKAHAVLLVEKSMFKRKKKKVGANQTKRLSLDDGSSSESNSELSNSESDSERGSNEHLPPRAIDSGVGDGKEWGKKVDASLREYITTTSCRNAVSDKYFDNPPFTSTLTRDSDVSSQNHTISAQCDHCDNCLQAVNVHAMSHANAHSRPSTPEAGTTSSPSPSVHSSPSKSKNLNGKRPMAKSSGRRTRRGEHLKTVRAALVDWRFKTHEKYYTPSSYTAVVILPDPILTSLASNSCIKTIEDMNEMLKPPWILTSRIFQPGCTMLLKITICSR